MLLLSVRSIVLNRPDRNIWYWDCSHSANHCCTRTQPVQSHQLTQTEHSSNTSLERSMSRKRWLKQITDYLLLPWQLQHIVQDETCIQLLELYHNEESNQATGGPVVSQCVRLNAESAFQRKAEQLTRNENCFKITIGQVSCLRPCSVAVSCSAVVSLLFGGATRREIKSTQFCRQPPICCLGFVLIGVCTQTPVVLNCFDDGSIELSSTSRQ